MNGRTMMIATRLLKLHDVKGDRDIAIQLFAPELDQSGSWSCRYEVHWPDGPWRSAGWGSDSVQAILLTLQKIGVELYTSDYHRSGQLVWEEAGKGYGFPVPHNARDLLVGDDALFGA